MKKAFVLFIALLCAFTVMIAAAEDLSALTLEELTARRQQLIDELTQVNALRGSMIRQQELDGETSEESLGKIIDLFPDEQLAVIVRDKCAKFSIEQPVTASDLEKVTSLDLYWLNDVNLDGIELLTNLQYLQLSYRYKGDFPEGIKSCKNLETINMSGCENVTRIPEWIGQLSKLQNITMQSCGLTSIPDSICDLQNLRYLYLNGNKAISALPENIGNLVNLKELSIADTAISSLPDSIWNLQLNKLDMSGTSIR